MKSLLQALKHVFFDMPIGLWTTFKHVFKKPLTLDYPRKKKPMSPRYRGRHYLERYDDGTERCVCCGLCAAACPADAIYMEPKENEKGERGAKVYEINLLRCIFCGFCEEACPEEAIFLGQEYEFAGDNRNSFLWTKEDMLVPHPRKDNPLKRIYRRVRKVYGVTDKPK
ncbi:MAG TPA: NADH-quinone oxidoreductase subunit NuoI [candidate division Zixibacteria bacterium]|nr:NADH-quinone oxidoreductase subunit NuoI [candidate division Zixibacteria bacterium]